MPRGISGGMWSRSRTGCPFKVYPSDQRETPLEQKRNNLSSPVAVEMTAEDKQRYLEEAFATD